MKVDCVVASRRLRLSQNAALKHTKRTTGDCQLAPVYIIR